MPSISAASLTQLLGQWRGQRPAFRALADRVLLQLVDGRVAAGTRLPAERELAEALGVSRTTVASAYAHLRTAGYLRSVRGSGSVLRLPEGPDADTAGAAGPSQRRAGAPLLVDLTRAALPGSAEHVLAAARGALEELPAHLEGPGYELLGVGALRAAVAERYTRRGLATRPDQVLVTLGAQHAVGLLLRTLTTPGDRVLVESPGYPHALEAVRGAGGRPVAVPVAAATATSPGGWDAEALEEAFARTRPALGYLMPGFHNPTGAVMPAALRARVCELARRCGTTLVVDETTNDLPIEDLPADQGAGATVPAPFPADVVHVGSASKSLWGGLRIGWVRADAALVRRLAAHRAPWELGTPVLEQLVTASALPHLDEVLARRRGQLRAGRDALLAALAEQLPEWELPVVPGGLTAWVNLGRPVSSALALAARRHGVRVTAGPRFGVDGAFERYLRLPFGAGPEALERAVPLLARAWEDVRSTAAALPLLDELV